MANEDPPYSNWLRRRPCQACGGPGPCEVHHSTVGDTVAPGERRPSKSVGAKRGKSQRSHDAFGISLHTRCHANFHEMRGFFSGFTQADLREWQEKRVEENRAAYEAELAAKGEEAGASGPTGLAPVPLFTLHPGCSAVRRCVKRCERTGSDDQRPTPPNLTRRRVLPRSFAEARRCRAG